MKAVSRSKRRRVRLALPLLLVALSLAPSLERLAATGVIVLVAADASAQAEDSTGTAVRKPHKQKRPRDYADDAAAQAQQANTPSDKAGNAGGRQREQDALMEIVIRVTILLLSLLLVVLLLRLMVRRRRKRGDATLAVTHPNMSADASGRNCRGDGSPIAPPVAQTVMAEGLVTGSPGTSSWEGTLQTSNWTPAGMAPDRLAQLQKSHIVGKVTHFDERVEGFANANTDKAVWNFRVEAEAGDSSEQMYSVEMRSKFFNGAIKNGDVVAFERKHLRRGRVTKLRALRNLSGGDVEVRAE